MNHVLKFFSVLVFIAISSIPVAKGKTNSPYPLEYFALREVVNRVSLSPNGESLAMMVIPTKTGDPVLEIRNTTDLKEKPFRVNADPMEITGYQWVSDEHIILYLRQKVRDKIDGFNEGVYESVIAKLDVSKRKIKKFNVSNPYIAHVLPKKKNKVILSFPLKDAAKTKLNTAFRPYSYYEFDLNTGNKKLLYRGSISRGSLSFNIDGEPVFARGFDREQSEFLWYLREPGQDKWEIIFRLSEDSFEEFSVEGFDTTKPNTLIVTAHNGKDKAGLWEYDYKKKSFGEVIYLRNDVDVVGTSGHSNRWLHSDEITGVVFATDKYNVEYFDPVEGATYAQLEKLIPYAHGVSISSRAREGQTMVVYNSGPRDPGTYYLIKDGKLTTIGSKQPLLKSENLADVKYISYKARDGKTIRAYVTIPNGTGPFPLVVMPHGGPFVQEVVGYDEWSQMLANNGYMVLQPQYRGSRGYGLNFFKSAFMEGGQGGLKMQDDKDDGALYLVNEGLADKDRIAMFGWSYGGYAALVAASRTPQIYQCVIAGASVADMKMQLNYYRSRLRGASLVSQLSYREGSVNPIDEVEKVNVPVLLIHGSVDQRVPVEHANIYREKLDKLGKNYKYVELEGADHFYNTLFYRHQIELYNSITDYLQKDCGPEGL